MSQLPPNPYGNVPPPPPPYGEQPVGQPPYGQGYPQGFSPPGFAPQPQTTSGAAIASLVLGILGFCIPVVVGLVAIVLGIVGVRSTGKPAVRGRGLAIAGLVLGILSLFMWAAVGGLGVIGYRATIADRLAGKQFLSDLAAGNVAAVQADCVPGTPADLIQKDCDRLKAAGPLADSTFYAVNVSSFGGTHATSITGTAQFGSGTKTVQINLTGSPTGGKSLVQSWNIP